MFEILERLQQRAAETTRIADGSKIAVGGDFILCDPVSEKFQTQPRGYPDGRQKVGERAKAQVDMAVGQRAGEEALEAQPEHARRDNDGNRRQRATGRFYAGNIGGEGRFQRWLKWTKMDFAWCSSGKIASRTHSE